jgi:CDP-6-deoxy-D-xylo-4-hexulose-3-dehydrase
MRSTELNGILGIEQLRRLDENNVARTENLKRFIAVLDPEVFQTDFEVEGSSNYAFTLILKQPNLNMRDRIEKALKNAGIEFRRGLSGGGNQLRQPYLKAIKDLPAPEELEVVDHIHYFSWYIGNYPDLDKSKIKDLGKILKNV